MRIASRSMRFQSLEQRRLMSADMDLRFPEGEATGVEFLVNLETRSLTDITLRRSNDIVQLIDNATAAVIEQIAVDTVDHIRVLGANGRPERVVVDHFTNGPITNDMLMSGLVIDLAGDSGDTVRIASAFAQDWTVFSSGDDEEVLQLVTETVGDHRITSPGIMELVGARNIRGSDANPLVLTNTEVRFEASLPIELGASTILNDGRLKATTPLRLEFGETLFASGSIDARFAGETGSLLQLTGDLSLGDAQSVGGVVLNGDVETGAHRLELLDADSVIVGGLITMGDFNPVSNSTESGLLVAANGIRVDSFAVISGTGVVDSPNDPATPIENAGSITGESIFELLRINGWITGDGSLDLVEITGTLSPGPEPALVTLGDATLGPDSRIILDILGPATELEFDSLLLDSGQLQGTLDVFLNPSVTPLIGDVYEVASSLGVVSGQFDPIHLPTDSDSVFWTSTESETGGLSVVVGLDMQQFDADGIIQLSDGKLVAEQHGAALPSTGSTWQVRTIPSRTVPVNSEWRIADTRLVGNQRVQLASLDAALLEIMGAEWTNAINRFDVDASGDVTALDALAVINELNRERFVNSAEELMAAAEVVDFPNRFYDVSGDGRLTALDALRVINRLNEIDSSSEPSGSQAVPVRVHRDDDRNPDGELPDETPIRLW